MKRLLACVSLVAVTTTAATPAVTPAAKPTPKPALAHRAPPIKMAPADEYFGKLKMSVLGIRNTIKDVGANIEIDQARWLQQASKAAFAEDAMRDWQHKYPKDTWLAKSVFALERMYAKLDTDEGRKRSVAAMLWLVHDFPVSWYGKTGKRELAQGKVGRPVVTAAEPSPSPSPAQSPGADQIAAPAVFVSPEPGVPTSPLPGSPVSPAPVPLAPGPSFGAPGTATGIAPDQAAGGVAATPVPNPLPTISPAAP